MERIEIEGSGAVIVDDADRTVTKMHPFRGLFWGLLFGIGLAGVLIVTTTITVSILTIVAVIVVAVIIGVVWGVAGPARKPTGPPPSTRVVVEQVPASRFDDFDRPTDDVAAPPASLVPPTPPSVEPDTIEPPTDTDDLR